MNQLVIVGNGFDLAHGLKTSYNDFMTWYLNKRLFALANSNRYEDLLLKMTFNANIKDKEKLFIGSINEYFQTMQHWNKYVNTTKGNEYFDKLLHSWVVNGWVDIEKYYYHHLVVIYKNCKSSSQVKDAKNKLLVLNEFVLGIKSQLVDYLTEIKNDVQLLARDALVEKVILPADDKGVMFVNFNYTNTLMNYVENFRNPNLIVNYIHGNLDNGDEVIFGYGDDIDDNYKGIEETGIDEFLEHIKTFWYLKNSNYQITVVR